MTHISPDVVPTAPRKGIRKGAHSETAPLVRTGKGTVDNPSAMT